MKTIAEYLAEAAKFDRMANDEKSLDVKVAMQKQAAAYRKLAAERAEKLGIAPPEIRPPSE
jgi:hypothetical protein